MNVSTATTAPASLPASPQAAWAAPRLPRRAHRRWAVPLATLGLLLAVVFLAGSVIFVDRYAEAPGQASSVERRLSFDAVPRYPAEGEVLFVTVSGPHLTGLQALIGWLDPDIDEVTYAERFGNITPAQDRTINLQAMRTSKDDAPYVALTKLGYPTELIPGKVVVGTPLCVQASADGRTCTQFVPAASFLAPGDEIVAVDGAPIATRGDLAAALAPHHPGDVVPFEVRRTTAADGSPGAEETGDVELIANPQDETKAFIGIELADTTTVKLPFTIDISTGSIGGPSAGLAFTLALLDELTPGELTGGKKVAATGTIDLDGNVGPIGGIRQKAVAVANADADLFIVPASQSPADLDAVRTILGPQRVVTVSTLDEALTALAAIGGNALQLGTPGAGYHA